MRPFRYLRDPLFLASGLAYAANRLWLAPRFGTSAPFLTQYLGDVLLIPCALPLLFWLQRNLGLRTHDHPPATGEILGTFTLWSILFECVFPHLLGRGVSDPLDVLAYAAGALLAGGVWSRVSRTSPECPEVHGSGRGGSGGWLKSSAEAGAGAAFVARGAAGAGAE